MKEVTLEKLNSSSFEAITKALAMEKFGSAGQVFPQGPDGGRDFAFEGVINTYEPQKWDGYLVLQAKFKTKIGGADDVRWLIEQLKQELSKFSRPDSAYRKPEYYIIATNINLSGADVRTKKVTRKSGLTKVSEHMKEWATSIGLKGFDIWPSDKIETFLAASVSIRTTYLASILPGDILQKISESLSQKERDLEYALKLSLIHLLKRDRNVRLKDAGSLSDDDIRASQVFVDLPARDISRRSPVQTIVRYTTNQAKSVYKLQVEGAENPQRRDRSNKVVLLGGPGQGKSTASLFMTQLFRASLIRELKSITLDDQTKFLISEIFERAVAESIDPNLPSRYPAWVSLPQFADKISSAKASKTKKPSLLSFIAEEISETSQSEVSVNDLRGWLKSFPWFFTFDGLDEVPPSGEREAIIAAIHELITETELLNTDAFFVVTSRPQGYNSDLESDAWSHKELIDLPLPTALSYAKLLAKSYYKDDIYRQKKIVDQLERSADRPTTQRLMKSPLQVTILHMIVDTGGGVPNSRWSLFHDYFEILKKREKSKGGEVQKILDKNITQIGPIHQRAGLILHVDAEVAGSATASLDMEKLSLLIENFLKNEGFDTHEIDERLAELTELALNRLVLLSCREESKISFDVRSLQEFMAAAALTANAPEIIEERLLLLAGKSHWQHVFTIAASRCFSEDNLHYLRSAITQIPKRLEDDPAHRMAGGGALLSLALFSDDIAADHPTYRRILALHALELLLHGFDLQSGLGVLIEPHTEQVIYDSLKNIYINNHSCEVRAAAWNLIVSQAEKGSVIAIRYVNELWPSDDDQAFDIIKYGVMPIFDDLLYNRVMKALFNTPYSRVLAEGKRLISVLTERFNTVDFDVDESRPVSDVLSVLKLLVPNYSDVKTLGAPDQSGSVEAKIVRIDALAGLPLAQFDFDVHPEWSLLFSAAEFSTEPSLEKLRVCLEKFRSLTLSSENKKKITNRLPWVISTALLSDDEFFVDIKGSILSGAFGDNSAWSSAESRVLNSGISLEDYIYSKNARNPGKEISKVGIVSFSDYFISSTNNEPEEIIRYYIGLFKRADNTDTKTLLSRFVQFEAIAFNKKSEFSRGDISDLLDVVSYGLNSEPSSDEFVYHEVLTFIEDFNLPEDDIKKLELIGRRVIIYFADHLVDPKYDPNVHILCSHLDVDNNKKGLINIICIFRLILRSSTTALPVSLLRKLEVDEDDNVRFSASTLLFLEGELTVGQYVSDSYSSGSFISDHRMNASNYLLENNNLDIDIKIELALALVEIYGKVNRVHAAKVKLKLKAFLDSKLSGLTSRDLWMKMSLPEDAFFQNTVTSSKTINAFISR
ncbi:hypothetical protein [Pseudomonas paracarnis]|uniref:NACHT domain-containing protein n=1 Tax=Pseudomonas paracarnis TaxID=2750625 RepID=UPI00301B54ED